MQKPLDQEQLNNFYQNLQLFGCNFQVESENNRIFLTT